MTMWNDNALSKPYPGGVLIRCGLNGYGLGSAQPSQCPHQWDVRQGDYYKRGLRQGDSLSLLLFVHVTDNLN